MGPGTAEPAPPPSNFENSCTKSVPLAERPGTLPAAEEAAIPDARRIPEATVARLPLYYRALLETADPGDRHGVVGATGRAGRRQRGQGAQGSLVSSAPTARAGWGTTSSTCSTRSRASSGSPTTGRSPSSASGTWARRSPTTAGSVHAASASSRSSTPIPTKVGQARRRPHHRVARRSARPSHANASVAIGIIATPAHAAQEVADRLVDAGVTSILNFAPTVVTAPAGVSLRKVDLAIELQILSFYQQRRDRRRERRGDVRRVTPMTACAPRSPATR